MADSETVTCPNCGTEFEYSDMAPREPDEEQDTMVDWLVSGRCPRCNSTVSLSFEEIHKIARNLEE